MNEGEFFEFLNGHVSIVNDTWASFITVFFAFIICAYLVGRKFSAVQSIALTTAYSFYSFLQLITVYFVLERIGQVGARHAEFYPQFDRAEYFAIGSVVLMAFVWLMSVVYMASENRKRQTNDA